MKTNTISLIDRTARIFASWRRQRRLDSAVRGFNRHMLADIGLERDERGDVQQVR